MPSGAINTGSYAADLEPIGLKWFMDAEKDLDPVYPMIFDKEKSDRHFEHAQIFGGLGTAKKKDEGDAIQYDSMVQGPEKVVAHSVYYNGFQITREMVDDGIAGIVMKKRADELRRSLNEKKEELAADILNNAFNISFTGADGKELCATDHPTQDVDIANELATAADLAESSLEQAMIDLRSNMRDYRGKRSKVRARKLIIPNELMFEAKRILDTDLRVGTADNDINALKEMGLLPEGFLVSDRLTDADAWFIKTDVKDGLKLYQRDDPEFSSDNAFDNENLKFKARERYVMTFIDYRGIFGTPGAG